MSLLPDDYSMQVSIPIDDDGYLDRACPNEICEAEFKVLVDDWEHKVRDEEVFCPICGHTATSDNWFTKEQNEHLKTAALAEVMPLIDNEMKRMVRDFNRCRPKGGLISVSMSYKPSHPMAVVPLAAAELMRQRYVCEKCGCRYAAIGAAFFCPSCGHNSAKTALMGALTTIRRIPEVRIALQTGLDRDAVENALRLILEEYMGKLVSSFQRFAEATFETNPNASDFSPRRNLFQNLPQSSDLWEKAIGLRYESMLTNEEWNQLQQFFQQRHVLAHKDGFVDDEYRQKTGDLQYQSGQRLVIKESDVMRFADLVEKLANRLVVACARASE